MGTEPTFVELSHPIEHGLETYPGLPPPEVSTYLSREDAEASYAPGVRFAITAISMVANTGTYIDAPYHRFENAPDLAELPLGSLANLQTVRIQTNARRIDPSAFAGVELADKAVLVATGWSRKWRQADYLQGYPFLTRDSAEFLVEAGARLVGIDSPNVDDRDDGHRPVHTALLAAGIPIVEHLTGLDALPDDGFRFFAVPPMIRRFTSFPVRAFALVEGIP